MIDEPERASFRVGYGNLGGGQKYTMLGANINQPHLGTIKKLVQPESKIWTLHWSEVE